jgi:large subunit ribosomal protein L18
MNRKTMRVRRRQRTRSKIQELGVYRLTVSRTPQHIYAQVIAPSGDRTVASASTLDSDVRAQASYGGNIAAAKIVGKLVAERARAAGVDTVAFDRSGFRFHGRVKALADAARDAGLSC